MCAERFSGGPIARMQSGRDSVSFRTEDVGGFQTSAAIHSADFLTALPVFNLGIYKWQIVCDFLAAFETLYRDLSTIKQEASCPVKSVPGTNK